jgi:lycopene beta-cyclase
MIGYCIVPFMDFPVATAVILEPMKDVYDVVIIGAGCAGMSLARELAKGARGADTALRICVIEEGNSLQSNKTWGFWLRTGEFDYLPIRTRYASWAFSTLKEYHVHQSSTWNYAVVAGSDFFQDAKKWVDSSDCVSLQFEQSVQACVCEDEIWHIKTEASSFCSRYVVDTRPPSADSVGQSELFQIFSGMEFRRVEEERSATAGLMERMECDAHGFRFDYVLPMGDRVLVESTRFSSKILPDSVLQADLNRCLAFWKNGSDWRLERIETGLIPMGLPKREAIPTGGFVEAGVRGGALRASSGYAFREIQIWAIDCAHSILRGTGPIAPRKMSGLLLWMDQLFLRVLRLHPERAADIFTAIATRVHADRFVRFMINEPHFLDVLRIMQVLPTKLFLKRLIIP